MRVLVFLLALLAASIAAAQPATTTLKEYSFDLAKVNPTAFRAVQGAMPASLRSVYWIRALKGVGFPMIATTIGDQPYLGGLVCEPHDCKDNKFAFLVTRDGKRVVATVQSVNVKGAANLVIGNPNADEGALLRKLLD